MVPTGTGRSMEWPSRPVRLLPSPWRPRWALCSGLKRKWSSVLWLLLATMTTSPPWPPSPPLGPPRGTYFSRRKARHPLPPSPALIVMIASSTSMTKDKHEKSRRPDSQTSGRTPSKTECLLDGSGLYADVLAHVAAIVRRYCGVHARIAHVRPCCKLSAVFENGHDFAESDLGAYFACQLRDADYVPGSHTKLLPAGLDDCMHWD